MKILCQITWPSEVVERLWDGSGPWIDGDGNVWRGGALLNGFDELQKAFNGEGWTLNLSLNGVPSATADMAWLSYTNDEIIGAVVQFSTLPVNRKSDRPIGAKRVRFTGTIDNILFDDRSEGERQTSTITVEVTNRFILRRQTHGAVLSDVDQKARSAVLNPGGNPDRFCERVPGLEDKNIVWPRWN